MSRLCACGCGKPVRSKRSNAKYASKACADRCWYANNREKRLEGMRCYYMNNREKHLASFRQWRKSHPEKTREYSRQWKKSHPEYNREYKRRLRNRVLEVLGGKCEWCGIVDPIVLDIDHINGGGTAEYRTIGSSGVYRKILSGETDGYQLLCGNCHRRKTHAYLERKEESSDRDERALCGTGRDSWVGGLDQY